MAQREDCSKKTETEATEDQENRHIPTDIYEEILSRLRVDDLLNCKRVCKDWLKLISSPEFIQKHLNRSKAGCNGTRILIPCPCSIKDYNDDARGNKIYKIIRYPHGFSGENMIILGFCDGLVCLADKRSHKLAIFNPSTGKSDIHKVDGIDFEQIYLYWFGHHPSTGEYVLVIDLIRYGIKVYTFSRNFKSVLQSCSDSRGVISYPKIGTLLNGNLHWAAAKSCDENEIYDVNFPFRRIILAYDFQKNKVVQIPGPGKFPFTLGVVDRYLCAIHKPEKMFELWIMKEYGVKESWTKYRNIEGYENHMLLFPLGLSWNGDLIIDADRIMLTKYSFSHKKATLLTLHDSISNPEAIACVDSLVSPMLL